MNVLRWPEVWRLVMRWTMIALLCSPAALSAVNPASAHDEPIRIGVNIEQSGGGAVLGEAYGNAVTLWAEQINEQGGILEHTVELLIRDNQSDPTQAVTQTKQLLEEGIVAMIGPGTSPTTLAAMPTIQQSGIPVISMGSADEIVQPASERRNIFKATPSGTLMAQSILADMKRHGIESIGLIAVNNPYGDDGVQAWEELAQAGDVTLVGVERFEADDVDMTAQLTNLLAAEPQAIAVWSIPPGASTVRRNAIENLGVTLPMYFDAGAGIEAFIELAGESANGARIVQPKALVWDAIPADDPQYEALQSFGTSYTAAYGAASSFAGYPWDALELLRAAIERAGSTEPDAVLQALEDLDSYAGATGIFDFTPEDHQGLRADSLVMIEVTDGRFALSG